MKYLMATSADKNVIDYTKYTHPILKMFAKKWKVDFRIFGSFLNINERWRILEFYKRFEDYDRVFFIDSDVVINKNCPNIFNIVPFDTIGAVFEDKGSRLKHRRRVMAKIKQGFGGNEHWTCGYFNMGVLLASKIHRDMFTKINGQLWGGEFAQTHLNYQMMKFEYKYIDLGYKWNHTSMFSEAWNGSPSRLDSYVIHYAGGGNFPDKGKRSRVQLIKDDIAKIYEGEYIND